MPNSFGSLLAVTGLIGLAGCVSQRAHDQHMAELNEQLAQREQELRELRPLKAEVERLRSEVEIHRNQKDIYAELSKDIRDILDGLRADGMVRAPNGAWVVSADLLFPSGSTEIAPEGAKILERFAGAWKGKQVRLRIVGHTDSDPIVHTRERYPTGTNLELGMYRALKVMERLNQFGIPERSMRIESLGASEPVDPAPTREAKKKNRRVEIFVQKA